LRFKAISSCPASGFPLRGTPLPVTSCDAIPPGGNYASADKMFHRYSLLGAAFLIPQACLCIKAQPILSVLSISSGKCLDGDQL
jgi:hypothetical protein